MQHQHCGLMSAVHSDTVSVLCIFVQLCNCGGWMAEHKAARESASGGGDKHSRVAFSHSSSPVDTTQLTMMSTRGKQW